MAKSSLPDHVSPFNQSALSDADFQHSEIVSKLELAAALLSKVGALMLVALQDSLNSCTAYARHCYLATMDEMVEAAAGQLADVLITCRSNKRKAEKIKKAKKTIKAKRAK